MQTLLIMQLSASGREFVSLICTTKSGGHTCGPANIDKIICPFVPCSNTGWWIRIFLMFLGSEPFLWILKSSETCSKDFVHNNWQFSYVKELKWKLLLCLPAQLGSSKFKYKIKNEMIGVKSWHTQFSVQNHVFLLFALLFINLFWRCLHLNEAFEKLTLCLKFLREFEARQTMWFWVLLLTFLNSVHVIKNNIFICMIWP